MADLTVNITETITLNNQTQAETYTQTISGINYIDTRNLSCPSGSTTELFKFSTVPGAGQFVASSFKYGRVTNLSSVPVQLYISSSTTTPSFLISSSSSFILSTSQITGSLTSTDFTLDDIRSISVAPSGADAQIEYYIATT
jgi:hypothetical protein